MEVWDLIVIGGGAAGYFGAIKAAEMQVGLRVLILEQGNQVLSKVKISGGGRCNVTHACWEPNELVKHYPRGSKELIGPFHKFMTGDTMDWYESRGVPLKIEDDGRVFPTSNQSQSIIDCLVQSATRQQIKLNMRSGVKQLSPPSPEQPYWTLTSKTGTYLAKRVLVATGSSTRMWDLLRHLGHTITPPVPSLFTFNIADSRIGHLPGISVPHARLSIPKSKLVSEGPLLITHWGLSGPSVLKLSAWGARPLHELSYTFDLRVQWMAEMDISDWETLFQQKRKQAPRQKIHAHPERDLPTRLWKSLCEAAGIVPDQTWAHLSRSQELTLTEQLGGTTFEVKGKSTFKDEFVTCGGVSLKEVDLRSMQSKKHPGLFFAGEVLDIDAVTGGFNFQAAWTTSWLAGSSIAS